MRSTVVIAVALFFLGGLACAQTPPPKLPAEVTGERGDFLQVKADTNNKVVRWYAPDSGLKLFPAELLKDSKVAVVLSLEPGRYRLLAWVAAGDIPSEPAVCWVVIGKPPPPPPPPAPSDPLVKALQTAYGLEADPQRAKLVHSFADFYRQAAVTAAEPSVLTWGRLFEVMTEAAKRLALTGKLPAVQKVIQEELTARLPTKAASDKALDTAGRAVATETFSRVAAALLEVKP